MRRTTVVVGVALMALACGGIGRTSSPGGFMISSHLLEIPQWCEPVALRLSPGKYDLTGCLPPGFTAAAARIELRPGGQPRVLAEVGPGFGACAAARLDLELVLSEIRSDGPVDLPVPPDARCEAIYAWPTTAQDAAWDAAAQLMPPKNRADAIYEAITPDMHP